jgi:hypothetical protein
MQKENKICFFITKFKLELTYHVVNTTVLIIMFASNNI